jgi:hypothetical protein
VVKEKGHLRDARRRFQVGTSSKAGVLRIESSSPRVSSSSSALAIWLRIRLPPPSAQVSAPNSR